MIKKIIKRTAMILMVSITAYILVGYVLHLLVFPEEKPDVANYFKPGHKFYSKKEGFLQKVEKVENGFVYCSTTIEPFAGGPPMHIHTSFDEVFEIKNGELSVWVDGEVKKIKPGDKLLVPKGTPHKPFNETKETIVTNGLVAFPEAFAYHLSQVYGYMENHQDFEQSPKTILQMAMFSRTGFDSYIADGPPVAIQKLTGFLVVPLARALGYKSYYAAYDIRNKQVASGGHIK